jgi:hypothetical protein
MWADPMSKTIRLTISQSLLRRVDQAIEEVAS